MKIPYGWIDEWPNWSLTISNRPWCPFVRLTTFYGFARKKFHRHMRRDWRGWISKSCGCPPGLTDVHHTMVSHRCPPPWYARSMPSGCPLQFTHVDHRDICEIAIWKTNPKFFLRCKIRILFCVLTADPDMTIIVLITYLYFWLFLTNVFESCKLSLM